MTKDLTGSKIGSVTVLEQTSKRIRGYIVYKCKCERCGKIFEQNSHYLSNRKKQNKETSCGCYLKTGHLYKNGLRNTRLYTTYTNMKQRCNNKNCSAYKNYGARGITVCKKWDNDFLSFYNWALSNGYNDNLTLDRIDNDKGYCPSNCRWVDMSVQGNNKRNNVLLEADNEEKTFRELCNDYNIAYSTLYTRIRRGWSLEKALTEPVHTNYRGK